ncbi:hypothetical protein H6G80_06070 [Nostoc sp. FACHB-87]|uniref:hypothetical protein n=1 Tax=Nostocales TaxID=1161 RepID=UPI0016844AA5|nr:MULTISPECIES: hypothetical protein [Nostocales]MBD2302466.1 hypothetical protein [Nostoc sp. FACHB-190]MBD2453642.1 hypothetical protein [Nostoc sp. FACHB-87]MBD2475404.1 hypothetical protein [Anabaena sp. FACHB-83]MBD2489855.1 hypothetical protein [Aulosira sp. FACHB-615]
MNQSSLNRWLTQVFGMLLGIGITIWILRGFGLLTFLPGGIIWLFILGAIAVAIINFAQRTWWRF